jgi:hypothetical protein
MVLLILPFKDPDAPRPKGLNEGLDFAMLFM